MNAFAFQRVPAAADAASAVAARPGAMFLAGGTTLVDLMKIDVLTPDTVVSVRRLGMSGIDVSDDAIAVGATVTNSQLAWHPVVRDRYPVLAEAILSGATTQIRNMATVAGNILQRTRCPISEMCMRRATGESRAPAATRSTASTVGTRCWAPANTALRHIHPTCAWRWRFSMLSFTRCGPMAPHVQFRSPSSTELRVTLRMSKSRWSTVN
jgi:CO/xanthine dehydrogenase FAD-binding subunit